VLALNAEDGSEKWSFETQASVRAGVVLVGDAIVAVDESGVVYRLDAETGDLLGQPNELEETVHATPLLIGGRPTSGSITPTPTDGEGREVLISTRDGHLWLLDVDQGRTSEVVD
jgi:outer membrane protein assembly factor BamB